MKRGEQTMKGGKEKVVENVLATQACEFGAPELMQKARHAAHSHPPDSVEAEARGSLGLADQLQVQ